MIGKLALLKRSISTSNLLSMNRLFGGLLKVLGLDGAYRGVELISIVI